MKILMIDDDTDLLEITQSLLSKKGYEVAISNCWEDGLKTIENFEPQLILLDVFLNGVDGLDICKQLKSMPNTRHTPVIILSAYPRVAESVYEFGADDFIGKPFEVTDLISKVHSVLSQTAGMA